MFEAEDNILVMLQQQGQCKVLSSYSPQDTTHSDGYQRGYKAVKR